jgi:hypothetical protein
MHGWRPTAGFSSGLNTQRGAHSLPLMLRCVASPVLKFDSLRNGPCAREGQRSTSHTACMSCACMCWTAATSPHLPRPSASSRASATSTAPQCAPPRPAPRPPLRPAPTMARMRATRAVTPAVTPAPRTAAPHRRAVRRKEIPRLTALGWHPPPPAVHQRAVVQPHMERKAGVAAGGAGTAPRDGHRPQSSEAQRCAPARHASPDHSAIHGLPLPRTPHCVATAPAPFRGRHTARTLRSAPAPCRTLSHARPPRRQCCDPTRANWAGWCWTCVLPR